MIAAQEDSSSGPSGVKVMRTLRALRLIKLLRLIRASRVLARLEVRVSTPRLTVTIIKLAVTSIAFGHMLGCVLGMLSAFSSPLDTWTATFGYCSPFDTSQGMADHSESFVVIDDVLPGEKSYVCVSPSALYFQSLWWALALISGASNEPSAGPLRPYYASSSSSGGTRFTLVEQIMQTVIILFGIFYFTIVTGVFVEAISSSGMWGHTYCVTALIRKCPCALWCIALSVPCLSGLSSCICVCVCAVCGLPLVHLTSMSLMQTLTSPNTAKGWTT